MTVLLFIQRPALVLVAFFALSAALRADEFRAAPGVVVEQVAADPLVQYPLFACFDDRGRLFVAEGTGKNLPGPEIVPLKLGRIVMLEDTNGDGKFDRRTVFADQLIFPQGVLWHDGAVYVASHPAIWKLTDTDGDGVADRREELVGRFGFTGNGCDIHGPFAGPDGWLYWTQGRHGYRIDTREGRHLEGLASLVWRCRYDGTGLERVAGGGFDNPVELAFTETGDLIGTADQYPGDMLLHYVEGGVYPRHDEPTLAEFPRTGPLLQPLTAFSAAYPAALCGLVRLESDHFGPGFRGSLLSTQFNVRRIQQHSLIRDGATLRSADKDFILTTDWDFHPTDVLEDADGSVLVVDMGSWFNYGCPTQKIAKAEVTGSIYRVRRTNALRSEDPWGRRIAWGTLPPGQLVGLLAGENPKVGARAAEELVKRGNPAVAPLALLVQGNAADASRSRREAVYVLSRIGTAEARAAVRAALDHPDANLREVALHCVGVERDRAALPALARIVVADAAPQRRKAAEALGRIGRPEAVQPLLASLRRGALDPFLEHGLIYALIRIGAFEATLAALQDSNPRVRRAGLIAVDQMNGVERPAPELPRNVGNRAVNPYRGSTFIHGANPRFTREHLAPLLASDDADLQAAVIETLAHRPGWVPELLTVAAKWVHRPALDEARTQALGTALQASASDDKVQQFVARALVDGTTPLATRRELLGVLGRSQLDAMPPVWLDALERILRGSEAVLQREALAVVRLRKLATLDKVLGELGGRTDVSAEIRTTALATRAPRTALDAATFERLAAQLTAAGDPLLPVTAATTLGTARLDPAQRLALIKFIATAGPLTAPLLTPAFHNTRDVQTAVALARALVASPGASAVTADELEEIFGPIPSVEVRAAGKSLFERRHQTLAEQAQYLGKLGFEMSSAAADPKRGEQVFFSKEAMCSVCHEVNGRGGRLGPDLSRIGAIRRTVALLESIVFPSSTIVPDFRAYTLKLKDGQTAYGPIARETSDAVYLRSVSLAETRIARTDIQSIAPSEVSFMPAGLEKTMTPPQLNDLLEYLYSLK
jgi:putative membrane-bound dehydrogenase-like protein